MNEITKTQKPHVCSLGGSWPFQCCMLYSLSMWEQWREHKSIRLRTSDHDDGGCGSYVRQDFDHSRRLRPRTREWDHRLRVTTLSRACEAHARYHSLDTMSRHCSWLSLTAIIVTLVRALLKRASAIKRWLLLRLRHFEHD